MSFNTAPGAVLHRQLNLLLSQSVAVDPGSLVEYYGNTPVPGGVPAGDALDARLEFLARLSGDDAETMESFPGLTNIDGSLWTSNGIDADVDQPVGTSPYSYSSDTPVNGRFNTTAGGVRYVFCGRDTSGTMTLTFSTPIVGFGLYFTDLGNPSGYDVTFTCNKVGGGSEVFDVAGDLTNGNLTFWGFIDTRVGVEYESIVLLCNSTSTLNRPGFDDVFFADAAMVIT